MKEHQLEMERLTMKREDKLSMEVEEFIHREKFKQKDEFPPALPVYFTDENFKQMLRNKPVQKTPLPSVP
jgi:hypothetical protein